MNDRSYAGGCAPTTRGGGLCAALWMAWAVVAVPASARAQPEGAASKPPPPASPTGRPGPPPISPSVAGAPVGSAAPQADKPGPARAAPGRTESDPAEVQGIEDSAAHASDPIRALGNVVLWLPRTTVDFIFFTSGTASGLAQDRQFVPRLKDFLFSPGNEIGVFPTVFAETGGTPSIGARMIARSDATHTSLRAGFGGVDELALEARVRQNWRTPFPITLGLEALYDESASLEFLGLGQDPEEDRRNRFVGEPREGLYDQQKVRAIIALGTRVTDNLELFASQSFTRRKIRQEADDPDRLDLVFAPGSVPASNGDTRISYSELALRIDTRETRGMPSPGASFETYVGTARSFGLDDSVYTHLMRWGGQGAVFFPILRPSNILSPKLVLDGLSPFDEGPIAFTELTQQGAYRGHDNRRDRVSLVGSLDYRWTLMRYLAARVFVDAAHVAPSVKDIEITNLRYAVGFGLDISDSDSQVGEFAFAFSGDGLDFSIAFGLPDSFGDRQHRK
ncbi:MAG: hypothetical protein WKG00_16365 [Polyangiaceae bacterium]